MLQRPSFHNILLHVKNAFEDIALELYRYQFENNILYRKFAQSLHQTPNSVNQIHQIPFLPVSFFKTHLVQTGEYEPQLYFTSSGTTGIYTSKHGVKDVSLYEESFFKAFEQFYGDPKQYCILGLLPNYLEREGSSLIYMVDALMQQSGHPDNGFYLHQLQDLYNRLTALQAAHQPTILFGVTFALLDFAEAFSMSFPGLIVIETGGMKGRKKEITRQEVHQFLQQQWQISHVHSEYGMTELLSQAYSAGNGLYDCPPWMRVLVREDDDPLTVKTAGKGLLNVIDLANIDSCAFLALEDVGVLHENQQFEVLGRRDNSDLRGCSLLTV